MAASNAQTLQVLDLATAKEVRLLQGHQAYISNLAFSANGKILVSASGDSTALVWDWATLTRDYPRRLVELPDEKLDGLWKDLGHTDSKKAYQARLMLASAPRQAVPLFCRRCKRRFASRYLGDPCRNYKTFGAGPSPP